MKPILDRIDVKSPCTESWEEMAGNDNVRFCSHCSKNVHDLSSMTRAKAESLLRESKGRLCVRYIKDEHGAIITAPPKPTHIRRRASVAAGVLAASLSLSISGHGQTEQPSPKMGENSVQAEKRKPTPESNPHSISGLVQDPLGAVIANAEVILNDTQGNFKDRRFTGDDGSFKFPSVATGGYELVISSLGFKKLVVQALEIRSDFEFPNPLSLEVGETTLGVVAIADGPLMETIEPQLQTTVQPRPRVELPLNNRQRTFTLGLIGIAPEAPNPTTPHKKNKKKLPR